MESMKLVKILDDFPEEFFDIHPTQAHRVFGGPTLIHLKREIERPIFISTLLHGNETTGFIALQKYFKNNPNFKRSVIILIGNTRAAEQGLRKLPEQVDFNRVWHEEDRTDDEQGIAFDTAKEIIHYCKENKIQYAADIHNNTGRNPYYGCVNRIDKTHIHLASLFSNDIVYFTEPHQVMSLNLAEFCPSTTVEAGLPGVPEGIDFTVKFIERLMNLDKLSHTFDIKDISLFHTIGRIKIIHEASIDFDEEKSSPSDFSLLKDFDENNFKELPVGTFLGYRNGEHSLQIYDNDDCDMADEFIDPIGNMMTTKKVIIPSMFTKVIQFLKDDCLGYLMEKITFK